MAYTEEQQAAIQLAKDVLCRYNYYRHKARQRPTIGSPVSDGMPKGTSITNSQELQNIEYADDPARRYCEECNRIITLIAQEESVQHAILLQHTYLRYDKTVSQIADELSVSNRTYFRMQDTALLMFGESISADAFSQLEREYKQSRKL